MGTVTYPYIAVKLWFDRLTQVLPVFSVQPQRHPRADDGHAEGHMDGHVVIPVCTLESELRGETRVVPRAETGLDFVSPVQTNPGNDLQSKCYFTLNPFQA